MKLIPLTQGKFAMVDDEDFEWLNQWKWYAWRADANNSWYVRRSTQDPITKAIGCVYMHRAIAEQSGFQNKVDHRDGDGLNNQRYNLRPCSNKDNIRNQGLRSNNKTGLRGVMFNKKSGRWVSRITVDAKTKNLGTFDDKIVAAAVYNEAALKYYGEFARLNDLSKYVKT